MLNNQPAGRIMATIVLERDFAMIRSAFAILVLTTFVPLALAGPKVTLVLGPEAPPLEKMAADELVGQLTRLYQAEVTRATAVPAKSDNLILLGRPETNPAIAALKDRWPKLSDQGHVVKSVTANGRPALVIGGGSPVATYWAVAEHGYRLGIRTFTFGDLDPIEPPAFHLDNWNVQMEPRLKVRGFTTLAPDEIGLSMWGLAEQQKLIRQLAKLKFNRLVVHLEPWYPCVDWEYKGVKRSQGWFSLKEPLAIDTDTLGRGAFQGQKTFDNPDLVGKTEWKDRLAAGKALVQGILDEARGLGMETCLSVSPLAFPEEMKAALPESAMARQPGTDIEYLRPVAISEKAEELWLSAGRAQVAAFCATYPGVDCLELRVPDSLSVDRTPQFSPESVSALWKRLSTQPLPVAGEDDDYRSFALPLLFSDLGLQTMPRSEKAQRIDVSFDGFTHEAVIQTVLAPRRVILRDDVSEFSVIRGSPLASSAKGILALELSSGRNVQFDVACQVQRIVHYRWDGFQITVNHPADSELEVHLLSRSAFLGELTPRQALNDLISPVCGSDVSLSVEKAFDWLEQSTSQKPELAATSLGNASNEMYRANTRSREGGRQYTLYFARRFEFAAAYETAIDLATKAEKLTDTDARASEMEKVLDNLHAAGVAMAAIARNSGDRAIIAALNRDSRLKQAHEILEAADR